MKNIFVIMVAMLLMVMVAGIKSCASLNREGCEWVGYMVSFGKEQFNSEEREWFQEKERQCQGHREPRNLIEFKGIGKRFFEKELFSSDGRRQNLEKGVREDFLYQIAMVELAAKWLKSRPEERKKIRTISGTISKVTRIKEEDLEFAFLVIIGENQFFSMNSPQ